MREAIIIGSGPPGYTAALRTARAQLKPLLCGSAIFVGGTHAEIELCTLISHREPQSTRRGSARQA